MEIVLFRPKETTFNKDSVLYAIQNSEKIMHYIRRRLSTVNISPAVDAEDIFQDVVEILARRDDYRNDMCSSMLSYICRIVDVAIKRNSSQINFCSSFAVNEDNEEISIFNMIPCEEKNINIINTRNFGNLKFRYRKEVLLYIILKAFIEEIDINNICKILSIDIDKDTLNKLAEDEDVIEFITYIANSEEDIKDILYYLEIHGADYIASFINSVLA